MRALTPASLTHFVAPAQPLRRYVTTYYFTDITADVDDMLYPEWASARYIYQGTMRGGVGWQEPGPAPSANMTGPTSQACRIIAGPSRSVGIGLLPLGWKALVGCSAHLWADRSVDMTVEPTFALFGNLWPLIRDAADEAEIVAAMDHALLAALPRDMSEEEEIEAAHRALTDPDLATVSEMADRLDMTLAQLERFSKRIFGFPPKMLLRRQRYVRTLGQVMLNPGLKWSAIIDAQYYDQAHFNRDFRRFMGSNPRDYMAKPHPIVGGAVHARLAALGDPLQALQQPREIAGADRKAS